MKCAVSFALGCGFLGVSAVAALGQPATRIAAPALAPHLQRIVDDAVAGTIQAFAPSKLQTNQVAVTLVDLRDPEHPVQGAFRGDVPMYPASVIKLLYLVAAHQWMEEGKLADTGELRRAMHDMVVESYNEATHYVVDLLTSTTSGPELPPAHLDRWFDKRNAVNRYFVSLGYTNINANKKPWCEGPYGREMQAIKTLKPSRNMLSTDATARLLTEIATGKAVSVKRCAEMLELMRRDPFVETSDPDNQARFTGPALPPGAKLWSKAGWTSETRHDATLIELPNGHRFVWVVFTVDHANEREILPHLARLVIAGLQQEK